MFAGNFAPRGWALCDGQLLAVSQNDALFSLLGTVYGGDGRTTFGLPDMRGRIPLHAGHGPGLSERRLGSKRGSEAQTLTVSQLPVHTHGPVRATASIGDSRAAAGNVLASTAAEDIYQNSSGSAVMSAEAISNVGGNRSHTNLQPYLCVNFIIALVGIYPSRH